jgi:hypothetical protein
LGVYSQQSFCCGLYETVNRMPLHPDVEQIRSLFQSDAMVLFIVYQFSQRVKHIQHADFPLHQGQTLELKVTGKVKRIKQTKKASSASPRKPAASHPWGLEPKKQHNISTKFNNMTILLFYS